MADGVSAIATYGQTLASSTLTGGAASVPGSFGWAAPNTAPPIGSDTESVAFTPVDAVDLQHSFWLGSNKRDLCRLLDQYRDRLYRPV